MNIYMNDDKEPALQRMAQTKGAAYSVGLRCMFGEGQGYRGTDR